MIYKAMRAIGRVDMDKPFPLVEMPKTRELWDKVRDSKFRRDPWVIFQERVG